MAAAPIGKTHLLELLRRHARDRPDHRFATFVGASPGAAGFELTFGELDRRALELAAALAARGLAGERVLVLEPPGPTFLISFLACVYAGAVAVPAPLASGRRRRDRLAALAADSRPAAALGQAAEGLAVPVLAGDARGHAGWAPPEPGPQALAFLQYTSGSTAEPKGVEVGRDALAANLEAIAARFGLGSGDVVVSWLPPYHDMGLVGALLAPLAAGARVVVAPPSLFFARPLAWLELISRHHATVSGAPSFAFELCRRMAVPAAVAELDLASWQVAFCGAEPIDAASLEGFAAAFEPAGFARRAFVPCYGLAEATLLVTAGRRGLGFHTALPASGAALLADAVPRVGCGEPAPGLEVAIVDPETGGEQGEGLVGEIWVRGASLARGYFRRPEATETVFGARLTGGRGLPYLRTGDLGFRRGGELFLAGRLKELVIVRGRNLHPQDLEATALSAEPRLAGSVAAAFGLPGGGSEEPVVVLEVPRQGKKSFLAQLPAVAAAVRLALLEDTEVEPRLVFVEPGGVPRTTSGKIARLPCRERLLAGRLPVLFDSGAGAVAALAGPPPAPVQLGPGDGAAIADWLRRFFASRLGVVPERVDLDAPVTRLGLDSMGATELLHGLERELGLRAQLAQVLGAPSLLALAAALARPGVVAPLTGQATDVPLPATRPAAAGQAALVYLHQLDPQDPAYNLASAAWVSPPLDHDQLRAAGKALVRRHESLRASFVVEAGTVVERIAPAEDARLDLLVEPVPEGGPGALAARLAEVAWRPFKLDRGPLVRLGLWRGGERDLLLLVVHHVAADLWSMALAWRELAGSLAGQPPAGAAAAVPRAGGEGDAQALRFFRRLLAGSPPAAELPADRPPEPGVRRRGGVARAGLPPALATRLGAFAAASGTTPYVVLLAAFAASLGRHGNGRRFTLGTLGSGRSAASTAASVGYLVNPLPLTLSLARRPSFATLVAVARRRVASLLAHAALPFPRLVEELAPAREPGRTPFFASLFTWQVVPGLSPEAGAAFALGEAAGPELATELAGRRFESAEIRPGGAQFDLALAAAPAGARGIRLRLDYDAGRFDRTTVLRFLRRFEHLLGELLAAPRQAALAATGLGQAERHQLLIETNDTAVPASLAGELGPALRAALARTPAAPALVWWAGQMRYGELAGRVERLAGQLAGLGVGPETVVALHLDRGPELVVAVLASLVAGAAFLPLDPREPAPRREASLADAAPAVLLVRGGEDEAPAGPWRVAAVRELWDREPAALAAPAAEHPEQLAYVLFTSGSTGRPKGAMNRRRALVNRLTWMQAAYGLGPGDRVLWKTPQTFDVAVWEMVWPFLVGAVQVVAPPGAHRDAAALAELIATAGVTVVHFVPSLLASFLAEPGAARCRTLRLVVASGEALDGALAGRFRKVLGDAVRLENLYGPTEAAIDVSRHTVPVAAALPGEGATVPLGRPIHNLAWHVVDRGLVLVGAGVCGQLALAGEGLARGYVGAAALTAARFVPDPFGASGTRLYLTGDRALARPDGVVVFHGRLDQQVKVNGVRLETGEVEVALLLHPAVAEAAVELVVVGGGGDESAATSARTSRRFAGAASPAKRLVAWLGCRGEAPSPEALRQHLAHHLPAALIPHVYVVLPALPRTASGKLDRRNLPAPERCRPRLAAAFAAPATARERQIAAVWEAVLGVSPIGRDDDFFALGGDSIRTLELRAGLVAVGLEVSLEQIQRHATVRELAGLAGSGSAEDAASQPSTSQPFALVAPADRMRMPFGLEDAYPLAGTQTGVVFHRQGAPGTSLYRDVFLVEVRGPRRADLLAAAVAQAVERHPMLRTSFDLGSFSEPMQLVHQEARVRLEEEGLAEEAEAGADPVARWLESERRRPLSWSRPPMVRFVALAGDPGGFWLALSFFEAVLDGWSAASLAAEVLLSYDRRLAGRPEPLSPPPAPYREFVVRERLATEDPRQRRFWRRVLAALPPAVAPASRTPSAALEVRSFPLAPRLAEELERVATGAGVGVRHVLMAAHLLALARLAGEGRAATGLEAHARPAMTGAERTLGMHMNILPLAATVEGCVGTALLGRLARRERRLLAHREFPFAEMARGRTPPVETVFNFTHFHVLAPLAGLERLEVLEARGFAHTSFLLRSDYERHPLSGQLRLTVAVDRERLGAAGLERFAAVSRRALAHLAQQPEAALSSFSGVSAAERHQLLVEWNDTAVADHGPAALHAAFLDLAATRPELVAVDDGNGGQLGYGELAARAGCLAARLVAAGARPDEVVAVAVRRTFGLPVAILGVLGAGCAFLPLDPADPPARRARLVAAAGARLLVLERAETALSAGLEAAVVSLAEVAMDRPAALPPPGPGAALAYLIFTSGSQGEPKGVAVPHAAAAHLVRRFAGLLGSAACARVLAATRVTFDISVLELFLPLSTGGTVILAGDEAAADPLTLLELVRRSAPTLVQATPAAWDLMLTAGWEGAPGLVCLSGGEALGPELADRLRRRCRALLNLYGPTETTIWATAALVPAQGEVAVDLGLPLGNLVAHVLDRHGRLVATGAPGELFLGGVGLARGYHLAPGTTAASFVPDPFAASPGDRLYRTGDRAKRQLHGHLVFLGRRDRQIKLHGVRLEPAEVEAALAAHPAVHQAVVEQRETGSGHRGLVAWLVLAPGHARPDTAELRRFLAGRLPRGVMPSHFVVLPALPLSAHGKVDRRRLPPPVQRQPPASHLEALLSQLDELSDDEAQRLLEDPRARD